MAGSQQGGSGDRRNMDSVSGWGKADKGDNSRLRQRRKSGRFDGNSNRGKTFKRNKKKTLRHIVMKYMHEIRSHITDCKSNREWLARILKEYGSVEAYKKKHNTGSFWRNGWRLYSWRWHRDAIKKLRLQIIDAGGDPNYRKLLDF